VLQIDPRLSREDVELDTSLVDDLALDSLKFVDLTFALEDNLEVAELPLQDWADEEKQRCDKRFTVASLVAFCRTHLDAGSRARRT
jgi:acyl carrier protein